jgi:hypothetical protein
VLVFGVLSSLAEGRAKTRTLREPGFTNRGASGGRYGFLGDRLRVFQLKEFGLGSRQEMS